MVNTSNINLKGNFLRLVLLCHLSFILCPFSFSQVSVADSVFVYTKLEDAIKEPEKVYNLDLSKQKLDSFPSEIFQFKNLRTLNLSRNKIKSIPKQIKELTYLRELNLSRNKIKEFIPEVCLLTNLKKLTLNQNFIEAIPSEIKNLKKLAYLDMWDNNLWIFPDELGELKENLKYFDLQNIQFSSSEQDRLRKLLPNTKFNWPPPCNCKD